MDPRQGSVKQWSNRSKISKSKVQDEIKNKNREKNVKKLSLTHGYLSLYRKVSYITLNNRSNLIIKRSKKKWKKISSTIGSVTY